LKPSAAKATAVVIITHRLPNAGTLSGQADMTRSKKVTTPDGGVASGISRLCAVWRACH
jgi:hypothetical protein